MGKSQHITLNSLNPALDNEKNYDSHITRGSTY